MSQTSILFNRENAKVSHSSSENFYASSKKDIELQKQPGVEIPTDLTTIILVASFT